MAHAQDHIDGKVAPVHLGKTSPDLTVQEDAVCSEETLAKLLSSLRRNGEGVIQPSEPLSGTSTVYLRAEALSELETRVRSPPIACSTLAAVPVGREFKLSNPLAKRFRCRL